MIVEIIRATIFGALPIACFTFLILQWSVASGRLPKFTDKKDLQAQFKKLGEDAKKAKKKAKAETRQKKDSLETEEKPEKKPFFHKGGDILHSKVMFFGGGFYGTMAFFTYIVIEIGEVLSFFGKIIDLTNWRFTFSIDFIIDFIINSIMNIVKAFIWFDTLPDYIRINEGWLWIIAAYLGYLAGIRFTGAKGDEAWQALSNVIRRIKTALRNLLPTRNNVKD